MGAGGRTGGMCLTGLPALGGNITFCYSATPSPAYKVGP